MTESPCGGAAVPESEWFPVDRPQCVAWFSGVKCVARWANCANKRLRSSLYIAGSRIDAAISEGGGRSSKSWYRDANAGTSTSEFGSCSASVEVGLLVDMTNHKHTAVAHQSHLRLIVGGIGLSGNLLV